MLTEVVAGRVYDYSHCVGEYMGGMDWPGEGFALPVCTVVGHSDIVYVLSRGMESTGHGAPLEPRAFGVRVGKFYLPIEGGKEKHLATFGGYGTDSGQLTWPAGLTLNQSGHLYVTDEWTNRVCVYSGDGDYLGSWGRSGNRAGEFNRPSGITIDSEDNIYIVDTQNHRVQKFTDDGSYLGYWGGFGSDDGLFNAPWGVDTDRHGYVYVVDHKNDRIQKFTIDGRFVNIYGESGSGPGQLRRPSDVAVDSDGDVYVADWANNRVQIFENDGSFLTSLVGDAQKLSMWARLTVEANPDIRKARRRASLEPEWRFAMPTGVTFDDYRSRLIVADTQRYRLQIYNKVRDYVEAQTNL